MLNHFFMLPDEAAAQAALAQYGQINPDNEWTWDTSRVIPDQRVVLARAVYDYSNPEQPQIVTPEQTIAGYFITVSLNEINEALRDLPDNACRLIGDSETGQLFYTAPDLEPTLLSTALIEPTPAGSAYTFGG